MSEITTRDAKNNFLAADSNRSKLFIANNIFESGTFLNAGGAEATFKMGLVLGRVAASNRLVPMTSAAADGSQFPVGILAQDVTVGAGATATVTIAVEGEVNANLVTLTGADTLATVVSDRTIGDRIKADTAGIVLRSVDDSTFYDN